MANSHDANEAELAWHTIAQSTEPRTQNTHGVLYNTPIIAQKQQKGQTDSDKSHIECQIIEAGEAQACQTDTDNAFFFFTVVHTLLKAQGCSLRALKRGCEL
jgi:hypothetical protein